jgi:hypothetical protein
VAYSESARTTIHRVRIRKIRVAGLVVVIAAVAVALGDQLLPSSSSTGPSAVEHRSTEHKGAPGGPRPRSEQPVPIGEGSGGGGPLGEADGAVPDGTTVFDDGIPGVAKLDPALLGALRRAATDAGGSGVRFVVDSGWRSPAYQQQLFQQAVRKYGSEAEASRWVAPPGTSAHVSGHAVDIGPSNADAWLSEHGAAYGLCRIYGNEPWHFELRPAAVDHGCPAMYADPTHDPRMQR